jgi:hypothetical protein
MVVRKVVTFPGFMFGSKVIMPQKSEWRVVISKREMDTLQRAADILGTVTELSAGDDDFGLDQVWDEVPGGEVLRCAESYLSEFVDSGPQVALTPIAVAKIEEVR